MAEVEEVTEYQAPEIEEGLMEFLEVLPLLRSESDRGAVLTATSFIDELLKRMLNAYLVEGTAKLLFDGANAPFGSFSAKTAAARALALISDTECRNIDFLRKIRNDFAHKVHVSFDDSSVSDRTKELIIESDRIGAAAPSGRARFETAAVAMILRLVDRMKLVEAKRLKFEDWSVLTLHQPM